MPLYAFYPCRLDAVSIGIETYELGDDNEASERAFHVLNEHTSAEMVVVWCGDRKVLTCYCTERERGPTLPT